MEFGITLSEIVTRFLRIREKRNLLNEKNFLSKETFTYTYVYDIDGKNSDTYFFHMEISTLIEN